VQGFLHKGAFLALFLFASLAAADEVIPYVPTVSIVISVPEQKLTILRDGCFWKKFPISTSKFGIGDSYGSYKTPVGQLRVCEKIGEDLASGSVIKQRHATGEVLPANSPGRDPIVTRILWLDGLEEQNHNARARGIYIHGTTEEGKIGKPVSYGCIRMRSQDVLDVFEEANVDTAVSIINDKFPHYAKYVQPKPKIIVTAPPPKPTPAPIAAAKPTPTPAPIAAAKPTPTPAPVAAAKSTPLPAIASAGNLPPVADRKTASLAANSKTTVSSKPAPVAEYRPPTVEPTVVHNGVTVSAVPNSMVAHAMEGSILSAGLPDGPRIPKLPDPPAPKDVTHFGNLRPSPPTSQAPTISLQDPTLDVSPALRAADTDANSRAKEQVTDDSAPKPHIAFRASDGKPKQ
jgi:hypothetical protein